MWSHWDRIIAHRHWVTIRLFGKEFHFCARCSGTVLGFLALKTLLTMLSSTYYSLIPLHIILPISLTLAMPSIMDWTTQTLGLRQSNNNLRFTTGFLEGAGIQLLSLIETSSLIKLLLLLTIGLSVLCIGFFGRRLIQRCT